MTIITPLGVTSFDPQDTTALARTLEVLVMMGENLVDVVSRLKEIYHSPDLTFVDNPSIEISFRPKTPGVPPDRGIKVSLQLYCDRGCRVPVLKVVRAPGLTCAEFQQVEDRMEMVKFWSICKWCGDKREDLPYFNVQWQCSKCQRLNS